MAGRLGAIHQHISTYGDRDTQPCGQTGLMHNLHRLSFGRRAVPQPPYNKSLIITTNNLAFDTPTTSRKRTKTPMSEFALMDSGSRPDVGHITRFSPPLLSDDASQRQVSGESATSSDDLWSVGRSPGSSHTSSSASLGPSRVDLSEQWRAHVTLAEFTQNLGHALKTLFPNQNRSRYKNVHVLLMRWEHGDPLLRVFEEMDELRRVFEDIFHFQVEIFEIPEEDSHAAVGQKVMDFSRYNGNSTDDLKIFYYAGHSRSNKSKNLLFTR